MRCITAEEREVLIAAMTPIPSYDGEHGWYSDEEDLVVDALIARGNMVDVYCEHLEFATSQITPRGRLALECWAAVNARIV